MCGTSGMPAYRAVTEITLRQVGQGRGLEEMNSRSPGFVATYSQRSVWFVEGCGPFLPLGVCPGPGDRGTFTD